MSEGGSINVHVVGTGTIGEPLAALLKRMSEALGIGTVSISKITPTDRDTPKINRLRSLGIQFAVREEQREAFARVEQAPDLTLEQAISLADVVVDCSSQGGGLENKRVWYQHHEQDTLGFLAQGSETDFGTPYARGVNDAALKHGEQKYIHIVSCNTHALCALLKTLGFNEEEPNLEHAHFTCIRRANDVSQNSSFIPSPEVGKHKHPRFGTHHAEDAWFVFKTLGHDLSLFSTALKVNSQYMHVVQFSMQLRIPLTMCEIHDRLHKNPRVGVTQEVTTNRVFSVGRDYGFYGRLFNYTVVSLPTLHLSQDGLHLEGYAFTPQDGNPLYSTVAAILWFKNPETYRQKLEALRKYLIQVI